MLFSGTLAFVPLSAFIFLLRAVPARRETQVPFSPFSDLAYQMSALLMLMLERLLSLGRFYFPAIACPSGVVDRFFGS